MFAVFCYAIRILFCCTVLHPCHPGHSPNLQGQPCDYVQQPRSVALRLSCEAAAGRRELPERPELQAATGPAVLNRRPVAASALASTQWTRNLRVSPGLD